MTLRTDEYRISYSLQKRQWVTDDGHLVRLRWGHGHGFSVPTRGLDNSLIEFTMQGELFHIYLSSHDGEFYIRRPRETQHDLPVLEFRIFKGHPVFQYFRKVFVRNNKEYERTLAHDNTWQSYGHDDGKELSHVVKTTFLPTNM